MVLLRKAEIRNPRRSGMQRGVFLDRDGTIARDVSYCSSVEDFEIFSDVPRAISLLNGRGFKVIVVTNQSGIARGYFTRETLEQIHGKMVAELAAQNARVDGIYYCPHHPDENCQCRKPGNKMFRQASREHNINIAASYVIGDRDMDLRAGQSLGCKTVLVTTGPNDVVVQDSHLAHFTADSLLEAAQWILENCDKNVISDSDNEDIN